MLPRADEDLHLEETLGKKKILFYLKNYLLDTRVVFFSLLFFLFFSFFFQSKKASGNRIAWRYRCAITQT